MKTVYKIETERTIIRCYNPSDALLSIKAVNSSLEHLRPWMAWARHEPQTLEEKIELLRIFRGQFDLDQDYIYGIFNKDETELIGGTGLHTRIGKNAREIGYWISQKYINQGLATEVVKALVKTGFEILDLNLIEIRCEPLNINSIKIPEKLGFKLEAILKNRLVEDEIKDDMIWSMFKEDYQKSEITQTYIKAYDACNNQIDLISGII